MPVKECQSGGKSGKCYVGKEGKQRQKDKAGRSREIRKMSSLIDYIDGKEPPVNAPSCRNLDCLYNEGGRCTQGLVCKQDETYEKKWFKHA